MPFPSRPTWCAWFDTVAWDCRRRHCIWSSLKMRGRVASRAARALKGLDGVSQPGAGSGRCLHATSAAQQAPDTMEVTVNGEAVNVAKGSTVMQACDAAGIDIPR